MVEQRSLPRNGTANAELESQRFAIQRNESERSGSYRSALYINTIRLLSLINGVLDEYRRIPIEFSERQTDRVQ